MSTSGAAGPIVVPLDGSELAERALPLASDLARRAGTGLELVHVHVPIAADPIHVEGLPVLDEHMHPLRREHERAYLEKVRGRLDPGLSARTTLLDGPIAAALAGHARATGAWLIALTTHGRGGVERAWLGSVADELARVSPVPLLLVRPDPASRATVQRIVVPLDGSDMSEAILRHAGPLARLAGAEIVLLEVVRPIGAAVWLPEGAIMASTVPEEDLLRQQEQGASAYLQRTAAGLAASGVRARASVEVATSVASAVLRAAEAEKADLIAMATHGRSGLARLALGSVADKVVRGSHVPVLLVRPPS
jgi:nucleotide-binding universal stress UspA family protein